ncbi:ethylbenzene dehydrogenase-related protein [Halorussus gelatinilyticus]|uniref:Ethylbenzene dehydrogenase-related protein n=1 Tax=Halorussus gelatinilyticus TaxID=2937524 RepID=A0A8U0IM10_9EURY|nr:ethylbenzene dehydrogenase-related protein [Halorussus gelatinilyticus]UPW01402.1 ethylbenzene dehydrogenase-related protein [Halorussus gelatinilyticus]
MLDEDAARRATIVTVVVVVALVAAQSAVTAAVTGGSQPAMAVESVPSDPAAATWQDAPTRTVSLSKQQMAPPFGGGSTDEVDVQTVHNETHTAFRLTWQDPTRDANIRAPENYSDAAAVMLRTGDKPPITMGAAGKPVDIWYWRASWQFENRSAFGQMYTYPHPNNETMPGRAAGNPLSKPQYEQFAQNYYAKGYGSLSHAPRQNVHATAEYEDGQWSVVFTRKHDTKGEFDASFSGSEPVYLAFAVWNGSADEVNGQKSITLQFTKLDTQKWAMSDASTGGSDSGSGQSAGGSSGTSSGQSSGPWIVHSVSNWVVGLVATTLLTWTVVYWRSRE